MKLKASIGKEHPARIVKTWAGDFAEFVQAAIAKVPVTDDKASAGWICGATFKPEYRHSENFEARHFLSLDYDHIKPEDVDTVLANARGTAFLAYTTWSHVPGNPRLRVWVPLSRPATFDEFQAVSRSTAVALGGIELAARESHTPGQFMYRPTQQKGVPFQHWEDTSSPYLDVDKVLSTYADWTDKATWPRRREFDDLHELDADYVAPQDKPGLIGAFNRAFTIEEAIERFKLPYERVR